jgi:hypothetical protein
VHRATECVVGLGNELGFESRLVNRLALTCGAASGQCAHEGALPAGLPPGLTDADATRGVPLARSGWIPVFVVATPVRK